MTRAQVGIWLVTMLAGCDPAPPGPPHDAGPRPDAFMLPDAWTPPPPDAWVGPDGGAPVIGRQSWTAELLLAPAAVLSITLDARAEAGTVRGVLGGGGISRTVVFDVLGDTLVARDPVDVGATSRSICERTTYTLDVPTLIFVDGDGDGTHETLAHVHAPRVFVSDGSGSPPQGAMRGDELATQIERDATAPTLTLDPSEILPGMPISVRASEPMSPVFAPQLVGTRTFPLAPDPGASAAAAWRIDTWDLPAGHYALSFDGDATDLVGLTAATLPTYAMDLAAPVALDAATPRIDVRSAVPLRRVGDLPGESPFGGTDTFFTSVPLVMAFDVDIRGAGTVAMPFQVVNDDTSTVSPSALGFAPDGTVSFVEDPITTIPPSTVSGYPRASGPSQLVLPINHPLRGRYYMVVFPAGVDGHGVCGDRAPGDVGMAFLRPVWH